MDPLPLFTMLLWSVQFLTAGILLLQASLDLFSKIQRKSRKKRIPVVTFSRSHPRSLSTAPLKK